MERLTMFIDRKTQYSKDVSSFLICKLNAIAINSSKVFVDIDKGILNFTYVQDLE